MVTEKRLSLLGLVTEEISTAVEATDVDAVSWFRARRQKLRWRMEILQ